MAARSQTPEDWGALMFQHLAPGEVSAHLHVVLQVLHPIPLPSSRYTLVTLDLPPSSGQGVRRVVTHVFPDFLVVPSFSTMYCAVHRFG